MGSLVEVSAWLGHADLTTTQRYLHHKSRKDEAARLARAFQTEEPDAGTAEVEGLRSDQAA